MSKSESLKYRSRKSHFSICHVKEKGEHANWLVISSLNNRWPLSHRSRQSGRCCLPASSAASLGPSCSGLGDEWGAEEEAPPLSASFSIQPLPPPPRSPRSIPSLVHSTNSLEHPTCPVPRHLGGAQLGRELGDGRWAKMWHTEVGYGRGCPRAVGTQDRCLTSLGKRTRSHIEFGEGVLSKDYRGSQPMAPAAPGV